MGIWQGEGGKKKTGGKITSHRKKRKFELGNVAVHTQVGKNRKKFSRTRGGNRKIKAVAVEFVNVYDPSSKKSQKTKILDVVRNPANPHFVRRGIITKGSIVRTELGTARITSRPGQTGMVNAVMVEGQKAAK